MQRSFLKPVWLLVLLAGVQIGTYAQEMVISGNLVEVVLIRQNITQHVIRSQDIIGEGWQNLPQVRFWRRVMRLDPRFSYLNVADTRQILMQVPTDYYNRMSTARKKQFKDSILQVRRLPRTTKLYVTTGKADFYQVHKALPSIDKGIQVFMREEVDPWYAQAILLIESPGQNRHSNVGAAGQFQLMKDVAIDRGLVVNAQRDDRLNFHRAARAAAGHVDKISLPQTRALLDDYGIEYEETDTWFRLLVLHNYHAGGGNVRAAFRKIKPTAGGIQLMQELWQTRASGFQNASQNYSQIALSALVELEVIVRDECEIICSDIRRMNFQ